MNKPFIYYLIAPAPITPALRELAVQFGDGGDAERLNFETPAALASDPQSVIAYGGSTGPVGQQTVDALDAMVDAGQIPPQVAWARCVNESVPPRIVRSSHAPTQARIDAGESPVFDLATALADVGMVIVRPEMP